MAETIIKKNILEQYKDDLRGYALYANRMRVAPNIKDGLKPVHRRILQAGYFDEKATSRFVKSAAFTGTIMRKYHPHGDAGVYDAMKGMLNWFEINIPLLDGDSNWGNFQGAKQAAARYTEAKISDFTKKYVIKEADEVRAVVDWIETYDNRNLEMEYMPIKIPLLLINGCYGIGIGMSCSIPPHNGRDVIDATLRLIDDPSTEVIIPPDQNMKCDIIKTNFKSICNLGQGKFVVRGHIDIIDYNGKQALSIKSTPDMVYSQKIIDKIDELLEQKKIIGIIDHAEESTEEQMNHVFILKSGTDPEYIKQSIYSMTDMQKTISVNFEVLENNNPIRMSYKSYLLSFIEFRKICKFRYYCNKLQRVQTKLHEKEIYINVIQSGMIDEIINTIKNLTDDNEKKCIEYFVKLLGVTDLQASFILHSQILDLSVGKLNKYINEQMALKVEQDLYMKKVLSDEELLKEIKQELLEFREEYGKPRNCRIIDSSELTDIPAGEFKVIFTDNNYIKKVPANESIGSFKGDAPTHVLKVDNRESVLIFDEQGKAFKLPIHKIPISDRKSNGTDIRLVVKKLTSNICTVLYEPKVKELSNNLRKYFVTLLTAGGNVKKLDLEDILSVPPSGIICMKLDPGDYIKNISLVGEGIDVIVYSKNKALRMGIDEIPHQKRNTKGQRAMIESSVDGLSIIKPNTTDIVVITESGKINRFDVIALPKLGRNKSGSKVIKLGKSDSIKCIYGANINDILRLYTRDEKIDINIADIPLGSSISGGNKMIPLKNDNIIRCEIRKRV